jgi:hypothetical protein
LVPPVVFVGFDQVAAEDFAGGVLGDGHAGFVAEDEDGFSGVVAAEPRWWSWLAWRRVSLPNWDQHTTKRFEVFTPAVAPAQTMRRAPSVRARNEDERTHLTRWCCVSTTSEFRSGGIHARENVETVRSSSQEL